LDAVKTKTDEETIDDTVVMEAPARRESREPENLGGEEPTVRQRRPNLAVPDPA
jgi:hypothetical protein